MQIPVSSLAEFISSIDKVQSVLRCNSADVWYRGVSNTSHALIPGVQWRGIPEHKHENMVEEFLTGFVAYEKRDDLLTGYDLYALMQHYGLPTRLLDWTLSPLTALFFALEKEDATEKRLVWAMDPNTLNKINVNTDAFIYGHSKRDYRQFGLDEFLPQPLTERSCTLRGETIAIVVQPKNRRISSQSGRFTLHGAIKKPVNAFFEDAGSNQCLCIEINGADTRKRLLRELRWLGITEDAIYQDLGALAKRLMREFDIPE